MVRIAMAIAMYEGDRGRLPTAAHPTREGLPPRSWRVAILPYLGHRDLYEAYRADESWNGPNNRQLVSRMPAIYACPEDGDPTSGETRYVAVRGPHTLFPIEPDQPGGPATGRATIVRTVFPLDPDRPPATPGVRDRILIVESARPVCWLEPVDLVWDEVPHRVNPPGDAAGIGSQHPGGANVAFGDAAVGFLPDDVDSKTLEALVDGRDRMPVDRSRFGAALIEEQR
jgi:prepilin-type processing-associated H-X9-DG protein